MTNRRRVPVVLALGLTWSVAAQAEPVVSGVQGSVSHGVSVTIEGSGFGQKSPASPVVWDDCSGTDPGEKWDFVYPYSNDPEFRLTYRTPGEVQKAGGKTGGVALPHEHVTRYFAGAHYNSGPTDAHAGYNVCAGKNGQEGATYTYISFYSAIDPDWHFVFDNPDPAENDHNFKEYDWAAGTGYMGSGPNLYFGRPQVAESSSTWGANYYEGMNAKVFGVDPAVMNYYPSTGGIFGTVSVPTPQTGWHKVELVLKHGSDDGFHRVYQDNVRVWDADVNDDQLGSPAARAETVFGGYAREAGSTDEYKNNWRYYADVYYDHSLARVVLADAATYADATVVEPQIPSAWSDGSISIDINQGRLADGAEAWVYVFDATGTPSTGYAVTLGQGAPAGGGGAPSAGGAAGSGAAAGGPASGGASGSGGAAGAPHGGGSVGGDASGDGGGCVVGRAGSSEARWPWIALFGMLAMGAWRRRTRSK